MRFYLLSCFLCATQDRVFSGTRFSVFFLGSEVCLKSFLVFWGISSGFSGFPFLCTKKGQLLPGSGEEFTVLPTSRWLCSGF